MFELFISLFSHPSEHEYEYEDGYHIPEAISSVMKNTVQLIQSSVLDTVLYLFISFAIA